MMMKRFVSLLMALLMTVMCVPALADGITDDQTVWAIVRNHGNETVRIKMYAEASQQSDVVAEVYSGVYVRVMEERNGFAKVQLNWAPAQALEGYMLSGHVDKGMTNIKVETPVLKVSNTAGGDGITLRSAPVNEKTNAFGVLPNGTQVTMLGVVGNHSWYLVQSGGMVGYAARYGFNTSVDQAHVPETGADDKQEAEETVHAFYGPSGNYVTGQWTLSTPQYWAVVNNPKQAERLHLRKEASYSSESLGRYYNGVRVEVLDTSTPEWTYVRIGELVGYMRTQYLKFTEPMPVSGMPVMEIFNPGPLANMKLRLLPDMNAPYDGVYKNGTQVTMMGFTADWAHVIVDGKMGFMRTEFLK